MQGAELMPSEHLCWIDVSIHIDMGHPCTSRPCKLKVGFALREFDNRLHTWRAVGQHVGGMMTSACARGRHCVHAPCADLAFVHKLGMV